jgi:hypothetical protein
MVFDVTVRFGIDIALGFVVRPFRAGQRVPMLWIDASVLAKVFLKNGCHFYLLILD